MHLRIQQYGEPILEQIGAPVVNFNDWLKKLADDMVETMKIVNAAGLAAQHVGYALQLCAINVLGSAKRPGEGTTAVLDDKEVPINLLMPLIIVNPALIPILSQEVICEEGSVSFPEICVPISRPEFIRLKFQDIQGAWHELKCGGILARCILHEYDQLHGILFINRARRRDLIPFESKLKKLKRRTQGSS